MKNFPQTISTLKKYFLLGFLMLALAFSPVQTKPADAWMAIPSVMLKNALDILNHQIWGIVVGAAKQAAAQAIYKQVTKIVGGGKNGPMFITNYGDFLAVQPHQQANLFMNDYISNYFKGRGSSSYEGFGGGGGNSKYIQTLTKLSKDATVNDKGPSFTYKGDPEKMFASGNFKDLTSFMNGNDMWTTRMNMVTAQSAAENQLKTINQTRAISGQGYLDKSGKNGNVQTPAITVKDTVSNAQDVPNKVVANAQTVPEVITSVVSSTVSQSLEKGISSADSSSSENGTSSMDDSSSSDGYSYTDGSSSSDSSGSVYSGSGNISDSEDIYQGGGSGGGGAARSGF